MTEKHEIQSLSETIQEVIDEVSYEMNTKPGNGPEVYEHFIAAYAHLEEAKKRLKYVEDLL